MSSGSRRTEVVLEVSCTAEAVLRMVAWVSAETTEGWSSYFEHQVDVFFFSYISAFINLVGSSSQTLTRRLDKSCRCGNQHHGEALTKME
jgi:hypothetical protein